MIVLERPAHERRGHFHPDDLPEQGFLDDEALPNQGAQGAIAAGAEQSSREFRGFPREHESLSALNPGQRLEWEHEHA